MRYDAVTRKVRVWYWVRTITSSCASLSLVLLTMTCVWQELMDEVSRHSTSRQLPPDQHLLPRFLMLINKYRKLRFNIESQTQTRDNRL